MRRIYKALYIAILAIQLSGCATTVNIFNRGASGEDLAVKQGFTKALVRADPFMLLAYTRFTERGAPIAIYIEGDGLAWESRSRLSDDPTPKDAIVVELASIDRGANVAYLARPGQYSISGASECDPSYWSGKRFSEEVIASMNKAVDDLKRSSGAGSVELVGYSGGGAVAVLVAARRSDVFALRTVGGNLDSKALSSYHNVSQLDGSLDPIDFAQKIAHIPQRHFVGANDQIVPAFVAGSFVRRMGDKDDRRITVVDGATHQSGWRQRWPELLAEPVDR